MAKIQKRVSSPIKASFHLNVLSRTKEKFLFIKEDGITISKTDDDIQSFSTKEKLIKFLDQFLSHY